MAVAFVTGTKYIDGQTKDVFYVGASQGDGFIYFNDDTFYRVNRDGTVLQLFYIQKQIWINTTTLSINTIIDFSPEGIALNIGKLFEGAGATNSNASVENAVQWMISKQDKQEITYSQTNRNLKNVNGLSYDCSSFVITAFWQAGFPINTASTTRDMRADFVNAGFTWISGSRFEAAQLLRGDILLNEGRHTQVYIGNGKDVNCGSTPARIIDHNPYYNYENAGGWNGVLRYAG